MREASVSKALTAAPRLENAIAEEAKTDTFSRAVTAVVLLEERPCNHHRTDVHLLLPEIRRAGLRAPNDPSSYLILFGNGWQIAWVCV